MCPAFVVECVNLNLFLLVLIIIDILLLCFLLGGSQIQPTELEFVDGSNSHDSQTLERLEPCFARSCVLMFSMHYGHF